MSPERKYYFVRPLSKGRSFPIDMLRYDRSTPAEERDSYDIAASPRDVMVSILLRCEGISTITPKRWESFGWQTSPLLDYDQALSDRRSLDAAESAERQAARALDRRDTALNRKEGGGERL